jgi:TRAP-type transport system large permease protein
VTVEEVETSRLAAFAERWSQRLAWVTDRAAALLLALLVLDVWLGVLVRYLVPLPITFMEEAARYLMIWVALLAVSSCIPRREHIGVQVLFERLPAPARRALLGILERRAFPHDGARTACSPGSTSSRSSPCPFFILAGEIMNRSGITANLVHFAAALVGWMRGGMAHSNMVASVMFAGITGAATADAAAFGNTLVPAMVKQGYTRPFACAVTAAGSIIGPTIPPSTLMIIYGSLMGVSIAGLFAAGIVPGLLICAICMGVIAALGKRLQPAEGRGRAELREILAPSARRSWPWCCRSSSWRLDPRRHRHADRGRFDRRGLRAADRRPGLPPADFQDLYDMCVRTARITGVIFLIIASASILGWWMTFNQIPQAIAAASWRCPTTPTVIIAHDPRAAAVHRPVHGHQRDADHPGSGAGAADPAHRHGPGARRHHDHPGAQHLADDAAGGRLPLRAGVGHQGENREHTRSLWPFLLAEVLVLLLVAYWETLTLAVPRWLGL